MEKNGWLTCLEIAVLFIGVIVVSTVVIMLAWGWVVPDVFASAVEKGIFPASISFWQALKLGILVGVLGGAFHGSSNRKS